MSLIPRHSLFDLNDIFDHFYNAAAIDTANSSFFSPRVDIKDKDGHYEIIADLPGVDKEKLSVTFENGVLTIEASTDEEKAEEEGRVIRKERRVGKFMRSFTLGNDVHNADINANFKDGVLTLIAPKLQEIPVERKMIEIH